MLRAAEAVRQMELSQKHEAEETAALEKVMQQVEANLETTTVIFLCCSECSLCTLPYKEHIFYEYASICWSVASRIAENGNYSHRFRYKKHSVRF